MQLLIVIYSTAIYYIVSFELLFSLMLKTNAEHTFDRFFSI